MFWPYAYGDFFYYALWPDDYDDVDPFWAYGYGDIYESIFSPYSYDEYVQGPGAPAAHGEPDARHGAELRRGSRRGHRLADRSDPDRRPADQQQNALLDDLGNAVVKASDEIQIALPDHGLVHADRRGSAKCSSACKRWSTR